MSRQWMIRPDADTPAPHFRDTGCLRHNCRPVVVIDPEDREQCVRLTDAYIAASRGNLPARPNDGWMQTALRSLVADPKPEEPTGLGAVVEDADSVRWIRVSAHVSTWARVGNVGYADGWRRWAAVPAVKVLSEGVTA